MSTGEVIVSTDDWMGMRSDRQQGSHRGCVYTLFRPRAILYIYVDIQHGKAGTRSVAVLRVQTSVIIRGLFNVRDLDGSSL